MVSNGNHPQDSRTIQVSELLWFAQMIVGEWLRMTQNALGFGWVPYGVPYCKWMFHKSDRSIFHYGQIEAISECQIDLQCAKDCYPLVIYNIAIEKDHL